MCNNAMKRIVLGPAKKRKRVFRRNGDSDDSESTDSGADGDDDASVAPAEDIGRAAVDIGDDDVAFDVDNIDMRGEFICARTDNSDTEFPPARVTECQCLPSPYRCRT